MTKTNPREAVNYSEGCPWCGKDLEDLWDHDWRGRSYIEIECSWCRKDIGIHADTTYVIYALAGETPPQFRLTG